MSICTIYGTSYASKFGNSAFFNPGKTRQTFAKLKYSGTPFVNLLKSAWRWLSQSKNQKTLAFIGSGLVIAVSGFWRLCAVFGETQRESLPSTVALPQVEMSLLRRAPAAPLSLPRGTSRSLESRLNNMKRASRLAAKRPLTYLRTGAFRQSGLTARMHLLTCDVLCHKLFCGCRYICVCQQFCEGRRENRHRERLKT